MTSSLSIRKAGQGKPGAAAASARSSSMPLPGPPIVNSPAGTSAISAPSSADTTAPTSNKHTMTTSTRIMSVPPRKDRDRPYSAAPHVTTCHLHWADSCPVLRQAGDTVPPRPAMASLGRSHPVRRGRQPSCENPTPRVLVLLLVPLLCRAAPAPAASWPTSRPPARRLAVGWPPNRAKTDGPWRRSPLPRSSCAPPWPRAAPGPLKVVLRGGTYLLAEPLRSARRIPAAPPAPSSTSP